MKKNGKKNLPTGGRDLFIIYLCFFLPAYFLTGCKSAGKDSDMLSLTFDVSQNTSVPLSEIAEHIDRIQLETKEGVYLKDIRQVEPFEDYLLVKDTQPELFVFDKEGNFVRTIGKRGEGPGEYSYCLQFALDQVGKRIFLKTNVGIMVYDLWGNFIEKHPLRSVLDLYYSNNKFYSVDNRLFKEENIYYQDVYFSIYDSDCNILDSIRTHRYESENQSVRTAGAEILRNKDNIYVYNPPYQEDTKDIAYTLYLFTDGFLQPYVNVHLIHSQHDRINRIFISDRFLIVSYNMFVQEPPHPYLKAYPSQCIYDIKTRKMQHTKHGFLDDIYDSGQVIIKPLIEQNMFYCIQEGDFSEQQQTELNPTIYIGGFKK